jgi:hypothetical protein
MDRKLFITATHGHTHPVYGRAEFQHIESSYVYCPSIIRTELLSISLSDYSRPLASCT